MKQRKITLPPIVASPLDFQDVDRKDFIREVILSSLQAVNDDPLNTELKRLTYGRLSTKQDLSNFVQIYSEFVAEHPIISSILFQMSAKAGGFGGPGEVLSYFAIDDVVLGGPTSRCDVLSSTGAPIAELKGVEVLDDGAVTGFQLGIAAQPACLAYCSGVIRFLDRYCVEYGDYPKHARGAWSPSNPTEVAPSILRLLRDKDLSMNSAAHITGLSLKDVMLFDDGRFTCNGELLGDITSDAAELHRNLLDAVRRTSMDSIHDLDRQYEMSIKNTDIADKPFAFLSMKNCKVASHGYLRDATYIKPYHLTQRSIKPAIKL